MGQGTKLDNNPGSAETYTYAGAKVIDWFHGFQPSDSMLGLVGAYVVVKDEAAFGFAFAVSTIELALHGAAVSRDIFVPAARRTITEFLSRSDLVDRSEYTFEYDVYQERFVEVQNPAWWTKSGAYVK